MDWFQTPLGGAFVSLLLGLLLGLERQRSKRGEAFAGIRTFPLFALCGFFGGLTAQKGAPLALPAILLAVAGFGLLSYARATDADAGVTTEMGGLLARCWARSWPGARWPSLARPRWWSRCS